MAATPEKPALSTIFLWKGTQVSDKHETSLTTALKKEFIQVMKWNKDSIPCFGILLMNFPADYEQTISFLQLQTKPFALRIGILVTGIDKIGLDQKIKLFRYGAAYIWQNDDADIHLTIIACLHKWITIEKLCYSPVIRNRLIGRSPAFQQFLRQVVEIAFYSQSNVLLTGARGTGKEQVAHIIHELDTRRQKTQLVVLDCSTLKKELAESELFGHEKGAFTGAEHNREGMVAQAHLGTLFLDEIGELPPALQAELLRVIQEGTYKRVGSNTWRHSRFRLVAATNKNIHTTDSDFRPDLIDRIQQFHIAIPSLDQRKEDIPLLAAHFVSIHFDKDQPAIGEDLKAYLQERSYPGNIRELKNLMNQVFTRYCGKGPLSLGDIPKEELQFSSEVPENTENWFEQESLQQLLQSAIESGYNLDRIEETIRLLSLKIATNLTSRSKDLSRILGKSERWVQMQKVKGGKLS